MRALVDLVQRSSQQAATDAGVHQRYYQLYKIHSAIIFVQSLPQQMEAVLRSLALTLSTTFYYICSIFNLDVTLLCTLSPRMKCTMNLKYEVLIQTKTFKLNHILLQVPMGGK